VYPPRGGAKDRFGSLPGNLSRRRRVPRAGCGFASLKRTLGNADMSVMFAARQRPLLLVEERLLALRLSLNTPVLATAEVPSGPARAVLAAYQEANTRRFAVIVRSLRGGAAVVYDLESEDAGDEDAWTVALDASLSFGESMGFVFDDEMLTDRRPETLRRALAALHEILAPPDVDGEDAGVDAGAPKIGSPEELSEILLEDELETLESAKPSSHTTRRVEAPPAAAAPAPAPVRLSKFRSPAPAPASAPARVETQPEAEESNPGRSRPLGRVRPVRVRVDAEAGPKSDPLLRLLADF